MVSRIIFLSLLSLSAAHPLFAATAPRCSVVSGVEGGPAIRIDDETYSPILFAGNNQFDRDDILIEQIRKAAAVDINLFSFLVWLDWQWTPEQTAETIDQFCSANPKGYFYVRIWLGPSGDWLKDHPDECVTKADGTRLHSASPSSVIWRETAADMLRKRLQEIANGPHGDRFMGVCLCYLQTGEWFYPFTDEFMDYSPANLAAFRAWLREEYRREKTFKEAWNDVNVSFDSAAFPEATQRDDAAWGAFRNLSRHQPAIDMQRFQNDLVADTITYFAAVAKEATGRRPLVGTFYGYTMELNNNGPRALAHSGHLALEKLLDCPDIDLIHAPYSYFERKLGQPGHLHLPADSLALHGKLGIMEDDTFTHLAAAPGGDLIAPGWPDHTSSIEETLNISRRNFANCFTHRCGVWFFDLLSDGRWNDPEFWPTVPLLRRMAAEARDVPQLQAQVAVATNEQSVHCMRDTTYPYLLQALSLWRSELDRIGTPVGYYLQSDLPRLPDSVKVLILPNAFQLTEEETRAIEAYLNRGNTVVWVYAPGLFSPDGLDPTRIASRVGLPVEARFDSVPMHIVSEPTGEDVTIDTESWQPRFVVTEQPEPPSAAAPPDPSATPPQPEQGQVASPQVASPRVPPSNSFEGASPDASTQPKTPRELWRALKDKLHQLQTAKGAANPMETAPASPPPIEILARYKDTNEIAAAATPFHGGVSVCTAVPRLPIGSLRYICQNSGVHLYHDIPAMTGLLGPYLVVHIPADSPQATSSQDNAATPTAVSQDATPQNTALPARPKQYTFNWPIPCRTITRVTPAPGGPIAIETNSWTDTLAPNTTVIYRCE